MTPGLLVGGCMVRVKGKEMVLTLRFSTFIHGYRTQRGFKAVTFLTSKVTEKSFCTPALSFES